MNSESQATRTAQVTYSTASTHQYIQLPHSVKSNLWGIAVGEGEPTIDLSELTGGRELVILD